jgi:hypothetical protein
MEGETGAGQETAPHFWRPRGATDGPSFLALPATRLRRTSKAATLRPWVDTAGPARTQTYGTPPPHSFLEAARRTSSTKPHP